MKIREAVDEFGSGQLSDEDLRKFLIAYKYQGVDTPAKPTSADGMGDWYNAVEQDPGGGAESFDMVTSLYDQGRVPKDVYMAVVEALSSGTQSQAD